MDHTYENHQNCEHHHCPICEGGLALCTVCGGLEGGLTSECCGRVLTSEECDDVYAGKIDFRDGNWVQAPSPRCPSGIRAYSEPHR